MYSKIKASSGFIHGRSTLTPSDSRDWFHPLSHTTWPADSWQHLHCSQLHRQSSYLKHHLRFLQLVSKSSIHYRMPLVPRNWGQDDNKWGADDAAVLQMLTGVWLMLNTITLCIWHQLKSTSQCNPANSFWGTTQPSWWCPSWPSWWQRMVCQNDTPSVIRDIHETQIFLLISHYIAVKEALHAFFLSTFWFLLSCCTCIGYLKNKHD